jgi:hypothetical protein
MLIFSAIAMMDGDAKALFECLPMLEIAWHLPLGVPAFYCL